MTRNYREQQSIDSVVTALSFINIKANPTVYTFERYDIDVTGATGIGIIEVKDRILSMEKFLKYWTKEGFILESNKYDALKNKNSMYINIFNVDGTEVIIGWNLTGIKNATLNKSTEFTIVNCPVTSEFTNTQYVKKPVYLLKRRTTTLRMIKIDGEWVSFNMNNFNKYFNL